MPKLSIQKLLAKELHPVIINGGSSFVVITYWWGRSNKNPNTQWPCPEDLEEGETLTRKPITYNKMITEWKKSCRKSKCNYLAMEYPEFAQKGMYQKAINFKPLFIQKALKACHPRAVLYIDGDMRIKRYPRIFDISGVDYMGLGWNSDFRPIDCYYPYVFEVSGGTMYFNNTRQAKKMLCEWHRSVKQYPLKAEDRLLSHIFNQQKMLLPTTTIQLPAEYLWLSDFNRLPKNMWNAYRIYIAHPACSTSEDRAFVEGADPDRSPPRYDSQITNMVHCRIKNMPFYEYVFFPTKTDVGTMIDWLTSMKGSIKLVKYDRKYGQYNKIYNANVRKIKDLAIKNYNGTVHLCATGAVPGLRNSHQLNRVSDLIPTAIGYLRRGNNVVYVPSAATRTMVSRVKSLAGGSSFLCRNINKRVLRYKKEFTLVIDRRYPMYFSAESAVLLHLLYMSETIGQIGQHFSRSFIFPSRIRCKWV
uniref:Nucleotide-diphospho-sugar transferase n=1 Tax=Marseillevirus LCMAC202 TaxID=2506606 RepID=A0A481YYE9_9VIRU|nr:MAG: hypothetical protein LCMAC202_03820 [Marseillevirus LCMAC202]